MLASSRQVKRGERALGAARTYREQLSRIKARPLSLRHFGIVQIHNLFKINDKTLDYLFCLSGQNFLYSIADLLARRDKPARLNGSSGVYGR